MKSCPVGAVLPLGFCSMHYVQKAATFKQKAWLLNTNVTLLCEVESSFFLKPPKQGVSFHLVAQC